MINIGWMRLPPHQQPRVGFGLVKKLIKISVHASNSFYLNLLAMDAKTDQEYQQLLKEDEYSLGKCRIQQHCWPLPLSLLLLLNLTIFLNSLTLTFLNSATITLIFTLGKYSSDQLSSLGVILWNSTTWDFLPKHLKFYAGKFF